MSQIINAVDVQQGSRLYLDIHDIEMLIPFQASKRLSGRLLDYRGWGETHVNIEVVKIEPMGVELRVVAQDLDHDELSFDFYTPLRWEYLGYEGCYPDNEVWTEDDILRYL